MFQKFLCGFGLAALLAFGQSVVARLRGRFFRHGRSYAA